MSRNRQRTPLDSDVRLGIPAVTNDPDSLRRVAEALKLAVEQLARQRGALGRSAVTVNDLLKLNIITPEAAALLDPGGSTYDQRGVAGLTKGGSADGSIVSGGTGGGGGTVSWGSITDKPLEFPPVDHGHGWDELSDVPSEFPPLAHSHVWNEIAGKPATFPPAAHSHPASDIATGVISPARLGTGVADDTTFLRGDNTWATPAGGGNFEPLLGNPASDGMVLHSNADGTRFWDDVAGGILPGTIRPVDLAAVNAPTEGAVPMYYSDAQFIWVDAQTLVPAGGLNMQTNGSLNMVT